MTTKRERPVWEDDDDELEEINVFKFTINSKLKKTTDSKDDIISGKVYEERLRDKYAKSAAAVSKPSWAVPEVEKVGSDSEDDEAMEALYSMIRSTGKITKHSDMLSKTYINTNKQKDITVGYNGGGPLMHVRFHPSRPVLMTAGQRDNTISFFEVCKTTTNLAVRNGDNFLQDVKLPNYDIGSCDFYNYGQNIFVGSHRKPFFYSYDLMEGKTSIIQRPSCLPSYNYGRFSISDDGKYIALLGAASQVFVFELKTMSFIHAFSATATVVDTKFAPGDSNILFGYAENATVYIWDLAAPAEQIFFHDEGCVGPTCLAISKNGQFVACGTNSAIINIYKRTDIELINENGLTIKPLYSIDNLTTQIKSLSFNHDDQLLAYSSHVKPMAYRLFHVASGTTYKNFPPKQEMLEKERINCLDFSPNSGFVALGTLNGYCRLYRLNHFNEY